MFIKLKLILKTLFAFLLIGLLCEVEGNALERKPRPSPTIPPLSELKDEEYPGTLKLSVDATDLAHKIFNIRETIPVDRPGRFVFHYPQWVPGGHSPRNDLDKMAGLTVTAEGQRLEWLRSSSDVFTFEVTVPEGAKEIELSYQFLTPVKPEIGRTLVTPEMLNLQWLQVGFYPAGYYTRGIQIEARVKLPEGWSFGTALETLRGDAQWTTFKTVTFETLVDSPLFAGRYFKRIELATDSKVPVRLNLVADRPEFLEAKPEHLNAHRNLVRQAYLLYGSHHYDHYDFLVALSDQLGAIGLEHHQSSENRVDPKYFIEWDKSFVGRDLLAHEFSHSWNGKFRRGADLWTPTFNTPMRDSLLWVYEGQTQYWGLVLAARAGLMTRQQVLDSLAMSAALYETRSGRVWRPLLDTTNDPIIANRRPASWASWQRSEDYYVEGLLLWLDVDTLIREKSGGKKSLDSFAKAFFGQENGSYIPLTYDRKEVIHTLNSLVPNDWSNFLKTKVEDVAVHAPLDGLSRGGYSLIYSNTPSEFWKSSETQAKSLNLNYSLGFTVATTGVLTAVNWDSPAFKAGLLAGETLVAVNGETYDGDRLKGAVTTAAKKGSPVLELLMKNGERYRLVKIEYRDGLRYPRLERLPAVSPRLDAILAPRK